jgi:hypothetical protein
MPHLEASSHFIQALHTSMELVGEGAAPLLAGGSIVQQGKIRHGDVMG